MEDLEFELLNLETGDLWGSAATRPKENVMFDNKEKMQNAT